MRQFDRMNWIGFAAIALAAAMFAPSTAQKREVPQSDSRLQTLYQLEAKRWEMWVGPDQKRKAEIVAEPVFRWQNLARANGQSGAMFVWIDQGRPVVIGGVFSNPENDRRVIMHEFHALGPDRLFPVFRDSESKWLPGAGVTLHPLPNSPKVEETFGKRTLQLRAIARDFTANSTDNSQQRWELRLLSKPLYRYDKPQGDIIDGALLAFVSDAGTDPEIILILEARTEAGGGAALPRGAALHFRLVRGPQGGASLDFSARRSEWKFWQQGQHVWAGSRSSH